MPLQSIVVIVLRLFCIQWGLQGIYVFLSAFRYNGPTLWVQLMVLAVFILFATVCWVLAPFLSRMVARDNSMVSISGLSRYDLYCFAFVFLGLDYVLSSLGSFVTSLDQYLVLTARTAVRNQLADQSFYGLARYGVDLLAGLVALLFANRWSKMLIQREQAPGGDADNITPR